MPGSVADAPYFHRTETLASIPGIRRVETAHALDALKRNPDWVAFPES